MAGHAQLAANPRFISLAPVIESLQSDHLIYPIHHGIPTISSPSPGHSASGPESNEHYHHTSSPIQTSLLNGFKCQLDCDVGNVRCSQSSDNTPRSFYSENTHTLDNSVETSSSSALEMPDFSSSMMNNTLSEFNSFHCDPSSISSPDLVAVNSNLYMSQKSNPHTITIDDDDDEDTDIVPNELVQFVSDTTRRIQGDLIDPNSAGDCEFEELDHEARLASLCLPILQPPSLISSRGPDSMRPPSLSPETNMDVCDETDFSKDYLQGTAFIEEIYCDTDVSVCFEKAESEDVCNTSHSSSLASTNCAIWESSTWPKTPPQHPKISAKDDSSSSNPGLVVSDHDRSPLDPNISSAMTYPTDGPTDCFPENSIKQISSCASNSNCLPLNSAYCPTYLSNSFPSDGFIRLPSASSKFITNPSGIEPTSTYFDQIPTCPSVSVPTGATTGLLQPQIHKAFSAIDGMQSSIHSVKLNSSPVVHHSPTMNFLDVATATCDQLHIQSTTTTNQCNTSSTLTHANSTTSFPPINISLPPKFAMPQTAVATEPQTMFPSIPVGSSHSVTLLLPSCSNGVSNSNIYPAQPNSSLSQLNNQLQFLNALPPLRPGMSIVLNLKNGNTASLNGPSAPCSNPTTSNGVVLNKPLNTMLLFSGMNSSNPQKSVFPTIPQPVLSQQNFGLMSPSPFLMLPNGSAPRPLITTLNGVANPLSANQSSLSFPPGTHFFLLRPSVKPNIASSPLLHSLSNPSSAVTLLLPSSANQNISANPINRTLSSLVYSDNMASALSTNSSPACLTSPITPNCLPNNPSISPSIQLAVNPLPTDIHSNLVSILNDASIQPPLLPFTVLPNATPPSFLLPSSSCLPTNSLSFGSSTPVISVSSSNLSPTQSFLSEKSILCSHDTIEKITNSSCPSPSKNLVVGKVDCIKMEDSSTELTIPVALPSAENLLSSRSPPLATTHVTTAVTITPSQVQCNSVRNATFPDLKLPLLVSSSSPTAAITSTISTGSSVFHSSSRRRHQCPFCPKSCERKDNLQAHIRTHTGERPYPCRYCPKAFPQKDHLRAHIRTHTGEKPYRCPQCLKAFAQLGNLHRHVKTHRA